MEALSLFSHAGSNTPDAVAVLDHKDGQSHSTLIGDTLVIAYADSAHRSQVASNALIELETGDWYAVVLEELEGFRLEIYRRM